MPANDFPHAHLTRAEGGIALLVNEFHDISIARFPSTDGVAERFKVSKPLEPTSTGCEIAIMADDLASAQTAYAKLWMESVAVGIGLGFHPDTPAADYQPPLEFDLAAQYDDMIAFCHDHLEDPYAVGYEAWEKAGLIESTPSP